MERQRQQGRLSTYILFNNYKSFQAFSIYLLIFLGSKSSYIHL